MLKYLLILTFSFALSAMAAETKSVFFTYPTDGSTVPLKFKAKFGVTGMKIRPAGEAPDDKASGHMHLIIDGQPAKSGQVIPADATHVHYGKGQLEGDVTLTPGKHTITLQLADGLHRGYGPELVKTINVTAK